MRLLANFPNLKRINLRHTSISNAALATLAQLKGLEAIYLTGCNIDAARIQDLQQALPGCRVDWD